MDLTSLLTVYGPLALGWVFAPWLLIKLFKVVQQYYEALQANTLAITRLADMLRDRGGS
jgi:hypothetical protein